MEVCATRRTLKRRLKPAATEILRLRLRMTMIRKMTSKSKNILSILVFLILSIW